MSQAKIIASIYASKPKQNAFPKKEFNSYLPITFESKENENRWFLLFKSTHWMKPMVTSLAPHKESLFTLDFKTRIYAMFDRVQLNIDDIMGLPAYQGMVYEFLASFSIAHGKVPYGEGSEWTFRIQNTTFKWSREQALIFLDFPNEGIYPTSMVQQVNDFWKNLTGLDDFGPKSSPYAITDEAWQYAHRSTNINCQPETVDYVTLEDLDLMWALNEGEPVDWFRIFTLRFLSMQQQFGARRFVGCTSLITLIAKKSGFQFLCAPSEHQKLDLAGWKKLKILARPIEMDLTDVSEDSFSEKEGANEPEEAAEKKRKVDYGQEINEKVEWDKVRRIVVYEF